MPMHKKNNRLSGWSWLLIGAGIGNRSFFRKRERRATGALLTEAAGLSNDRSGRIAQYHAMRCPTLWPS